MATEIVLIRHGETEWSRDGRHTGNTDVPLTERGREQAKALGTALDGRSFARDKGLVSTRAKLLPSRAVPSASACSLPRSVSGTSVLPVCLPSLLHSVSPCRMSTISVAIRESLYARGTMRSVGFGVGASASKSGQVSTSL